MIGGHEEKRDEMGTRINDGHAGSFCRGGAGP